MINKGLDQIDQVTHQNTALAEQSAAAAQELAAQAALLQEMLARFTLKRTRISKKQTVTKTSQRQLPESSQGYLFEAEPEEEAGTEGKEPKGFERVIALDDKEFGKY
jgi:methyl-accepting chemotaxis protein